MKDASVPYRVKDAEGVVHRAIGVLLKDVDAALPDGIVVFIGYACDHIAQGRKVPVADLSLFATITCLACAAETRH